MSADHGLGADGNALADRLRTEGFEISESWLRETADIARDMVMGRRGMPVLSETDTASEEFRKRVLTEMYRNVRQGLQGLMDKRFAEAQQNVSSAGEQKIPTDTDPTSETS